MNRYQIIFNMIIIATWCALLSVLTDAQKDYIYNILVIIILSGLVICIYAFHRYEKSKPVNNKKYRYKYTIMLTTTLILFLLYLYLYQDLVNTLRLH